MKEQYEQDLKAAIEREMKRDKKATLELLKRSCYGTIRAKPRRHSRN